jgi:hypothetical protein
MADPSPEVAKAISLMPVPVLSGDLEDNGENRNASKMTSIKF